MFFRNSGCGFSAIPMSVADVGSECKSAAFRLPLSGYFNGSVIYRGAGGYWWGATRTNAAGMYGLLVSTTGITPSSLNGRYLGFTLRCVLGS